MPTLLRVDGSIRTTGSISRAVADSAVQAWTATHPSADVVHRDVGAHPLPADAWALSVAAHYLPEEEWTPEQRAAVRLAAELADEVVAADAVVLAAPLYNFGVSQHVKTWIDLLISDPRLGPGTTELAGTPALLVVSQGGGYRAGTPRHGWDHATGYLERILTDTFGMDVNTVVADLTLAAVTPAMSHLVDVAEQSLATAHGDATRHGTGLAALVSAA